MRAASALPLLLAVTLCPVVRMADARQALHPRPRIFVEAAITSDAFTHLDAGERVELETVIATSLATGAEEKHPCFHWVAGTPDTRGGTRPVELRAELVMRVGPSYGLRFTVRSGAREMPLATWHVVFPFGKSIFLRAEDLEPTIRASLGSGPERVSLTGEVPLFQQQEFVQELEKTILEAISVAVMLEADAGERILVPLPAKKMRLVNGTVMSVDLKAELCPSSPRDCWEMRLLTQGEEGGLLRTRVQRIACCAAPATWHPQLPALLADHEVELRLFPHDHCSRLAQDCFRLGTIKSPGVE